MNRLLAISWVMPPLVAPRSVQISRTLRALQPLGWQSTVIYMNNRQMHRQMEKDESLMPDDSQSPSLIRLGKMFGQWFSPKAQVTDYDVDAVGGTEQTWVSLAIPKVIELANTGQFGVMVSFAQPWSDHIIGLAVKRATGIQWIAHFSDPWIDSPYIKPDNPYYSAWKQAEEEVIREADRVIFTNQRAVDLVMGKYPAEWRKKACFIPHGYDVRYKSKSISVKNDKLHLMYSGNFYGIRTPVPLLEALKLLTPEQRSRIKVSVVGNMHFQYGQTVKDMGLEDVVHVQATVPYGESLKLANTADVLLLIDAPSEQSVFLPSKLVDYIMLEKPILGITPLDGESADLIGRLGCPVHDTADAQGIARSIVSLLDQWTQGQLTVSDEYRRVAETYDICNVAKQWDKVLTEVTS